MEIQQWTTGSKHYFLNSVRMSFGQGLWWREAAGNTNPGCHKFDKSLSIATFPFLNQDINTVLRETTELNSRFISVRRYLWQPRLNGRNHIKRSRYLQWTFPVCCCTFSVGSRNTVSLSPHHVDGDLELRNVISTPIEKVDGAMMEIPPWFKKMNGCGRESSSSSSSIMMTQACPLLE